MNKQTVFQSVGVLGLVLAVVACFWAYNANHIKSNGVKPLGATTATGMLAENYIPYVMYNGGYNSAKDINTSAYLGTTGTFQLGSSGSTMTLIKSGTCVLTSNSTIVATSTGQGTCATTGSLAGDIVYLNLATTTTVLTKQFVLLPNTVAATDSTTVTVQNLTGANGVPAAVATLGSSTQYQIFR